MAYEEKLERGEGSEWARKCWEEIKRRGEEGRSRWEEQRKEFYRVRGVSVEWVRRRREEGRELIEEMEGRDREVQEQERYNKVQRVGLRRRKSRPPKLPRSDFGILG